jgi:DNA processing protein
MSYQKTPELVNTPWNNSRLGWLGLTWFEKSGPVSLANLHKYFTTESGDKAWQASQKELSGAGFSEKVAKEFCEWREKIDLENLKQQLDKSNIDFILPWDKSYPSVLKQSHSPPGGLFWRGATMDNRNWIAVVGTRKMSSYGERATKLIVSGLVERGAGIVSGLALGIDGAAHKTALDTNGKTIAVLGSGIDDKSIYPQAHQNLAEQILLSNGAIISEFPPKTQALKHHFPQRNRIIASLCQATVVIEADLKSGSVLTAKNALDENRDVFAVPGSITSDGSRGTHELIRNGATICENAGDILNFQTKPTTLSPSLGRELTMDERNILDLCRTPIHVDDLSRHLNTSPASIASTCMSLELIGALANIGSQNYEITPTGRSLLSTQSQ